MTAPEGTCARSTDETRRFRLGAVDIPNSEIKAHQRIDEPCPPPALEGPHQEIN